MSIDEKVQKAPANVEDNQEYGVMQKINNIAKSKYGSILTGIGTLLTAASLYALNPDMAKAEELNADKYDLEVAYQDDGKKGVKLPDLSDAEYMGEKGPYDVDDDIKGKETKIKGYKIDNKIYAVYTLPNEQIYGFGVKDLDTKKEKNFWDKTNDGIFEQVGDTYKLDQSAYGY